jgi:hypothetical protein
MYIDKQLLISDSQSIVTQATAKADYAIDLSKIGLEANRGVKMAFVVTMDVALVDSNGSPTLQFVIVTDADAALSDVTTIYTSAAFTAAQCYAGKTWIFPIPEGAIAATDRWLSMEFVTGAATADTGSVSAFLVFDY